MNFSQEERAGKAGHNGFRVMNPPGGKSNFSLGWKVKLTLIWYIENIDNQSLKNCMYHS